MDQSQLPAPKSNVVDLRAAFQLIQKYNMGTEGFDRRFTMTVEMASLIKACPDAKSSEALARFIEIELNKHNGQ